MPKKQKPDFAKFTEAVQNYGLDEQDGRATSHTSAVSVSDWDKVQKQLAKE